MKKSIIILVLMAIGIVAIWMVNACKPNEDDIKTFSADSMKDTAKTLHKTNGPCWCDPTFTNKNCEDCVAGKDGLMKGATVVTYEITWEDCISDEFDWTKYCHFDKPTKVTFCYGNEKYYGMSTECDIYMQVDQVPECLKCFNYTPFCEKLKTRCNKDNNGNLEVLIDYTNGDTHGEIRYDIQIVGDPKITLHC